MVFSAPIFLFSFLPVTLLTHYASPRRARNAVLLFGSLIFYALGSGLFVVVLVISTCIDWIISRRMEQALRKGNKRSKRWLLGGSVVANLAMLGWYKYANFAVEQLNAARPWFGYEPIIWTTVVLPIGISFFTFQRLSYVIDVSRGVRPALQRPQDLLLYVALFPQLIAGPIVRYDEIADQLTFRDVSIDRVGRGALRFSHGLAKKVLIADGVAVVADSVFGDIGTGITTASAWLGAAAYTIQIYFDFSGYSDMAIGLGLMLGFRFPENFRRPYSAVSLTDFWRRWHITLSAWFRDYLYLPLGGSRRSVARTYGNLWIVFIATGLWHGAAWTFILWGAYHGVWLALERWSGQRPTGDDPVDGQVVRRLVTLLIVIFGWVLFRAAEIGDAAAMMRAMLVWTPGGLPLELQHQLDWPTLLALLLGSATILLPRDFVAGSRLESEPTTLRLAAWRLATSAILLPYAAIIVASGSFSPFLYFRF